MQLVADAKHQSWNRSILFRLVSTMAPPVPSRLHRYSAVIGRAVLTAGLAYFVAKYGGRFIVDNFLRPSYIASAELSVPPPPPDSKNLDGMGYASPSMIIKSGNTLLPVIRDLDLVKTWSTRVFDRADNQPLTQQEALDYLTKHLAVDATHPGRLKISVGSDVPKEAADLANAIADRYKTLGDVEEEQRRDREIDALNDQIAAQQKVVDEKKAALEQINRPLNNGGNVTGPKVHRLNDESQLAILRPQLLQAAEDYEQRRVLVEHIAKLPDERIISTFSTTSGPSANWNAMLAECVKMEGDADALKKNGTSESDPAVQSLRTKIKQSKDRMAKACAEERQAMQTDLAKSKAHRDQLQKQVTALSAELTKEGGSTQEAPRPAEDELAKAQSMLETLKLRLQQNSADLRLRQSPVQIISRAEPPRHPTHHAAHMLTDFLAIVFAIMAACFVEMVMLFRRAGDRDGS